MASRRLFRDDLVGAEVLLHFNRLICEMRGHSWRSHKRFVDDPFYRVCFRCSECQRWQIGQQVNEGHWLMMKRWDCHMVE